VSEAMAALGIPTTRALAAVTTGENVVRDELFPGAVLTRIASSHIRVGTFQFFANRRDQEALRLLATHALERHYPDALGTGNDALALFERVVEGQANLVALWLGVGFVHGVMNTDNTSISGETIDYGPCAFLDEYDPKKTFSSIDHGGRYAFSNQPRIMHWNLARLAETLLPLIAASEDEAVRLASERLDRFGALFERAYLDVMKKKLGLVREDESDDSLVDGLLALLSAEGADYTLFFRRLSGAVEPSSERALTSLFAGNERAIRGWLDAWRRRFAAEPDTEPRVSSMRRSNPAFIPRNHRVEEAIEAAVRRGDFRPFETLVHVVGKPYDDQLENAHLADPPSPDERVTRTFCGT
jgi:uncharacterized protein YdiU (UPF0061 family)